MALVAWEDLTLCTIADVEAEAESMTRYLGKNNAGAVDVKIQAKILLAKSLMFSHLKPVMQKRYADTANQGIYGNWYSSRFMYTQGYTLTQLDTILDKIANPECLRLPAVARTIGLIVSEGTFFNQMAQDFLADTMKANIAHWDCEYKARMVDAEAQLKFDLDNDGIILDRERASENNMFWPM